MICPEGMQFQNELVAIEDEIICASGKKVTGEGSNIEINSLSIKNPRTWKKSLTNFFRSQLRSTRSNDGDRPTGSQDKFEEKEISPEQKWQSLGKIFKRQSFAEHWNKPLNTTGESSSQNKRLTVRKVFSSYFGKNQNSPIVESEK